MKLPQSFVLKNGPHFPKREVLLILKYSPILLSKQGPKLFLFLFFYINLNKSKAK